MQTRWQTASREELIAELERQQREIERLRREHERADRDRNRYRQQRDVLRKKIDRLEDQLDDARRKMYRQAAPFSRGAPATAPRRPGRRAGRAYGRKAHRAIPTHVDEHEHHRARLPAACPDCHGPLHRTGVARQYQEDLPVVRPIVRAFTIEIGRCDACGGRVQGRHPLQTSEALGAAAAQLGPQAITLAAVLHTQLGLPIAKVSVLFRGRFGLHVTRGGLVHALHRAADRASPTYDALRTQVRQSDVVTPDETGWKVGGQLQWLWAFATRDTTVYAILPGRGFEEAASVLGADFDGTLVRDGWSPYRRFDHAIHQTCLAHLLRRCRTLIGDHRESHFAPHVQRVLHHALTVRDRYRLGTIRARPDRRPRPSAQSAQCADRSARRPSRGAQFRRAPGRRVSRRLDLSPGARRHRRDQLARRTRAPACRRHAQSLWRQSVGARCSDPTNSRKRATDHSPTPTRCRAAFRSLASLFAADPRARAADRRRITPTR